MANPFEDPADAIEISGAWLNVLFGALVVATPLFTGDGGGALWNAVISGAAVIALAAFTWWTAARGAAGNALWSAGLNAIVGAWILVSPFVLNLGGFYMGSLVTLGLFIAFTAGYNAWTAWTAPAPARERARA